ncbi:uncharacterized protein LOC114518021 isoform X2 [Dendronephthya gigantea]|uniref:uncharacterized protein LOC114518021 isoform X2 n=1 Tax=Dendronephthya gigantea TaxID=151771 RepID=UPI00106D7575|nr:uncharacterized protein LOC114518021 isoform X2 [Dendronephthya gigantea]
MASSLFKYIILVVLMCELQNVFAGTRYQPSIIWEKFNPMLKCKCNWMTITKLDILDRVELVCPNPILVSALRLDDVSKAHVFYDMYIRKFNIGANNSLEDLEKALHDDSFCDPTQSKKLYSCVRDDPRGAYKLRIHSDDEHYEGDISVIFSNSDTGQQGDLSSTRKKCALVFIINVTSSSAEKYDMSYRKCLSPGLNCHNKNKTCLSCCGDLPKEGGTFKLVPKTITRYQPSIIWERFNPMLKCKCNWMTITKLDIYDRVELVCPNSILVSALRLDYVSKAHVYYDMYIRKFNISANNSLEELEKALYDDSFCDPTKSKKLYSCVRGDPRGAYKLRIHSDDEHYEGDISVIFSNSDTGKQGDLSSTRKKCALVFIINVTSSSAEEYDMTYRKCLSPGSSCHNKNKTCLACCGDPRKEGGSSCHNKNKTCLACCGGDPPKEGGSFTGKPPTTSTTSIKTTMTISPNGSFTGKPSTTSTTSIKTTMRISPNGSFTGKPSATSTTSIKTTMITSPNGKIFIFTLVFYALFV